MEPLNLITKAMTKLDENQSKGEVHQISDERDDDNDNLLPRCERTQVHNGKPSTRHPADTDKESVDVFDAERRTRGTEYASINNRNKCTDRKH